MATFVLLGDPVGQSVSPAMHNAAFAAQNLSHHYQAEHTPLSALSNALQRLRQGEWSGANVTIPHKQAVLPYLDQLTALAAQVGAVNTIWRTADGLLCGDNTDVGGFLADLADQTAQAGWVTQWQGQPVVVLGAGGSARAVLAGLHHTGSPLRLVARDQNAAQTLVETLGLPNCRVYPYTTTGLAAATADAALAINCTPLGMFPHQAASPWLPEVAVPAGLFAYDLIYNPSETQWIAQVRAAGALGCTGLGMLVQQGALAYQRWVGQMPPLAVMLAAARAKLAQKDAQRPLSNTSH